MGRRSAFACLGLACLLAACRSEPETAADLVLVNGKILTVDPRDSVVEAVAVKDGKILAVGADKDVRAFVGASTRVVDLKGRTATPGLVDSHVHFSEADALFDVALSDAASVEEIVRRVGERASKTEPGQWIQGRGWDEGKLAEKRYVTAADLDAVSPKNPVYLTHTTGHYGVANSAALKLAGVTKATKAPPAGTIDRDPTGAPTGVLKESAQSLVARVIPPRSREQEKAGVVKIIEDFNKEGMTGAKDPGMGEQEWGIYNELLKEGKLTVRVFALWSGARKIEDNAAVLAHVNANPRPPQSLGDGLLLSGGVKMYMDGSGGARTAWMSRDWNKGWSGVDQGNSGYPTTDPKAYRAMVRELHDQGVHVSTHAIGDKAIDWVVDTYAEVLRAKPTKGLRHGIIHCNTPTDHANEVMASLQKEFDSGYPEAQAPFMWWIGDNYAGNLGPDRAPRLEPFATWQSKGIRWGGGSDYSVTPFPARYGLWSSVARKTLNGVYGATPFGTQESVDIKTALRSYTIWAAHQMFLDDRIGSLEVGKDADVAVWDRNMYEVPTDDLKNLKCEMTLFRGKVVYEAAP